MASITIIEAFAGLRDPRVDRTKLHKLTDIITIALCGAICGVDNWVEMERFGRAKERWFKSFLELPNGIPSHDTMGRVFGALDPESFRECFLSWVQGLSSLNLGEVVAIDGKSVRRALNANNDNRPLHMVNAWATEAGLALGQVATDDKSNEIKAIPKLLEKLRVEGCIVTTDAMGCQKSVAKAIQDSHADYVLQLKNNHPTTHQEVQDYFDEALGSTSMSDDQSKHLVTIDGDHGRVEQRDYWLSTDIDGFEDRENWPGLKAFGMVEAQRTTSDGNTTIHRRYYLSSVDNVADFARAVRSHWAVENSLHWILDMAFDEDHARARIGHAAENLAILRQAGLNLLKQEKLAKVGIKTKRKMCGWDHDYLLAVLGLRSAHGCPSVKN